jgi:hypothetical protein
MSIVEQMFGSRMSEAERDEVRKTVAGIVKLSAALKAVPLENGDEPFSTFVPVRPED